MKTPDTLPELSATNLVSTYGRYREEDRQRQILELNSDSFTRLVTINIFNNTRLVNHPFRDILELISHTDKQFNIFAEQSGLDVVPHQFGLINTSKYDGESQDVVDALNNTDQYRRLIPEGFLLGCEVQIVDPVQESEDVAELRKSIGCKYYKYLGSQLGLGNCALRDIERPDQYMYGTVRGSNEEQPKLYLVDVEPRLIKQ